AGRRPARGLILRAGGNTVFRWAERAALRTNRHVPMGDPTTDWGSSLTLGGLSNYWTAAVPRMSPEDFTDGAKLDERFQWPISYTDSEPFYERAERLMPVPAGEPICGVPPGLAAYSTRLPGAWVDVVKSMSEEGAGVGTLPMAKGQPWMAALRATGFN